MAINLNLASKPFNNRVLPWALSILILFVSLLGLVLVVKLTTSENAQSARVQAEINALKQEENSLNQVVEQVKGSYSGEQLLAIPAAHELVNRKEFSWSRLLADLEASLPGTIKVSRISVGSVTTDGAQTVAQLELVVFSKSPTTVTDMIKSMREAGIFNAVLRSQNLQKGRGETGTEYELDVIYQPRAGYSNKETPAVAELNGSEVTR